MDAVTYPTETVIEFLNDVVVPLKISVEQQPAELDFNIQWTPALLLLDQEGNEHHRTIGFLSPEELIPSVLLGLGNMCFHKDDFKEALNYYNKILDQHLGSDAVPEAIFQVGVCCYKSTNDPKPLKEAYEHLQRDYSTSTWTKRAYPYRLIQ